MIVGGVAVGSIKEIELRDDGQALVKMEITDDATRRSPRARTRRSARQSLSGVANR